jgi:hypothetical protein
VTHVACCPGASGGDGRVQLASPKSSAGVANAWILTLPLNSTIGYLNLYDYVLDNMEVTNLVCIHIKRA